MSGGCGCACCSGGFCGGCGHAGCGRRGQAHGVTAREAEARVLALAFAATYDTPNVRTAISYAESGLLTWSQVAELFARSYGEATERGQ